MNKYTYSIRSYYPEYKEPWVTFKKNLNKQFAEGYFYALRERPSPYPHTQLVRSDGKVVDEFEANEEVHIGMSAGFATAEQLRRAAQKALERADNIDKLKEKEQRRIVVIEEKHTLNKMNGGLPTGIF